jgi:LmbE family N-acetylglucosaminyl deacetylase
MTDRRLLAVFAHPDDETFRCGGTLALLARQGVQVWVLCATRGEAGIRDMGPEETGRLREAELQCACRALGTEPPRFLDYRDGTLGQVDEEEAVEHVTAIVRELRPQVLLTWPPDGMSGHPDHIAVSRWAAEAFQRAADPTAYAEQQAEGLWPHASPAVYHIVMPHSLAQALGMIHLHTVPDEAVTLVVDVAEVWAAKMAAIRCHRSQRGSSPILSAPEEKQRLFLGTEYFRLAAGQLAKPEEDILQRLKDNHT